MTAILIFGILVGLDNLQVSAALGLLPLPMARKVKMAALFGLFEAVMPLIGLSLGRLLLMRLGPVTGSAEPLALLLCGTLVIALALKERDVEKAVRSPWMLAGLPFSLSLDNLVAGAGLSVLQAPIFLSAFVIGAVSGAMCFAGLFAGGKLRGWIPCRTELLGGGLLVAMAVLMMVEAGQ